MQERSIRGNLLRIFLSELVFHKSSCQKAIDVAFALVLVAYGADFLS